MSEALIARRWYKIYEPQNGTLPETPTFVGMFWRFEERDGEQYCYFTRLREPDCSGILHETSEFQAVYYLKDQVDRGTCRFSMIQDTQEIPPVSI